MDNDIETEEILNISQNNHEHGIDATNGMSEKQRELESIQNDLNDLMLRLSNFIADSQDFYDSDENFDDDAHEYHGANYENKKDIGNEKFGYVSANDYYVNDGIHPPEINWDILAPYIQSIVSDLHKLRSLNIMTSNVMSRIRGVTEDITVPIVEEAEVGFEDSDKDIDEKEEDENETESYDDDDVDIE